MKKGITVVRLGPKNDYCTGRIGIVKDVCEKTGRIQVNWHLEANGIPMTPRTTWVKSKFIKPVKL